jgi:hypothetical protein
VVPAGLRGRIYFVPPGTFMLPKFEALKPAGSIYTASLSVWPREFSEGFPGVTNRYEWFVIDYTGRFWIEKPGEYRFSLTSDDGAKLYIDDRVAIDNDGIHEPQTVYARVALSYGVHRIRVSYFQGPRYLVALVLSVAGPHEKWRVFSTNEFKPPPNPEDWKQGEARELPVFPEAGRRSLRGAAKREPFEAEALAALKARPLPHAFDFRAAAFRFGNGGGKAQTSLAFEVPGASLTATPQPDHKTRKLHLSLLALVKDASGQIVDKSSLDAPYEIPEASLAGVRASSVTYTHPVGLPAGRYTVETAVLDREGRTASANVIPIEVPGPHRGVGLSSVLLVERVEPAGGEAEASDPLVFQGRRAIPSLATSLTPDAKPQAYFVVYPDQSSAEKPMIQVEFLVDGRLLAKQTAELPPAEASGAIPMVVSAATLPGNCELRITAVQGSQSATESVHYVVAAR